MDLPIDRALLGAIPVALAFPSWKRRRAGRNRIDSWQMARRRLVDSIRRHGVRDARVLQAMGRVPRHLFIPGEEQIGDPYGDYPCAIGYGQTISQPYIVAYMTERLRIQPRGKVLEIGTGSGYQAAILAELGAAVYSVEAIPELAKHAERVLKETGYASVHIRVSDGYEGWREEAPFDAIIATCAAERIPPALVEQLADGGRMILPVGTVFQELVLIEKHGDEVSRKSDLAVRFVPMVHGLSDATGRAE